MVAVYGSIDEDYVCDVNVVFDGRMANIASQHQRGLDFNIDYLLPTDDYGVYNFNLYATTVLDNKVQSIKGAEFSEEINGLYEPVRWRGRAGLGWFMDPISANIFVNYVGNGVNDAKLYDDLPTKTPSWITFDFGITYKFSEDLGWKGFGGTRISLNMQNMFDKNPPIILTSSNTAYDPTRHNPLGRITTLQLVKDF